MDSKELRALMDLLMCSDPWPVPDQGTGDGYDALIALVTRLAVERGFTDWIDAYHNHVA